MLCVCEGNIAVCAPLFFDLVSVRLNFHCLLLYGVCFAGLLQLILVVFAGGERSHGALSLYVILGAGMSWCFSSGRSLAYVVGKVFGYLYLGTAMITFKTGFSCLACPWCAQGLVVPST